jgi:hypothetical protein
MNPFFMNNRYLQHDGYGNGYMHNTNNMRVKACSPSGKTLIIAHPANNCVSEALVYEQCGNAFVSKGCLDLCAVYDIIPTVS